jgi:large subunit ribosomal protein L7/L12
MAVDLEKLADELSTLNVLEASQLVKMLEEKWGVSAAAPVAVATVAAGSAEPQAAEEAEEKTEFDVVLKDQGPKKVEVIKVVRQLVNNLSLVEAKTLVETAGAKVLTAVSKEAAEDAKGKLEAAGAVVEVA